MSTYLLFLGIGDFERIATKVDGTDVGVVVNRGDAEKGRYALQEAARLLHYYNEYFGVPYPLPKLDLVVAPGEIHGAPWKIGAPSSIRRKTCYSIRNRPPKPIASWCFWLSPTKWRTSGSEISSPWPGGTTSG